MSSYLVYLFLHRTKAPPFSVEWFRAWAKRLLNLLGLLGIIFRVSRLRTRGAHVGPLSVIGRLNINGPSANLQIGGQCFIGSNVDFYLHERITVGQRVVINDGCLLLTGSHDVRDPDWNLTKAPITIHDYVWIARNAIILPGVTVGFGAVIGAGAVVSKDIPPRAVAVGNPARIVGTRADGPLRYSPVRFVAPFEAWVGIGVQDSADGRPGGPSDVTPPVN